MSAVHPTAIVEPGAQLGAGCVIHPYAFVGRHCVLADGVVVHPFAVIGGDPQDLHFDPASETGVSIGAGSVIREHVTISRATRPGESTRVGASCFLMASCHLAHDCKVGAHVIIANAVLLAGHVQVGDRAFLGGGAVVHQFCRIGEGAMIGGGARISGDVPPFSMATERDELIGLNVVGLRRRGVGRDVLAELKRAFHLLSVPVGNLRELAVAGLQRGEFLTEEARRFLAFYTDGKRRYLRSRRAPSAETPEV
jgi:UDP-N-acetylglucosamine acyltransferase